MNNMKTGIFLSVLWTMVLLGTGCQYHNEEALYPGDCKTDNISYTEDVLPILQSNCYHCHDSQNNQGSVTLEGYDKLKTYIDNGRLLGAVRRENGFSPMPQDAGQLSDCLIDQIAAWAADGAPDN